MASTHGRGLPVPRRTGLVTVSHAKNLAAAIAVEAAELQEQFLWKTDKEIERNLKGGPKQEAVVEEIADVLMFAILLADRLDIDVVKAIADKLAANELKYPVALARGNARKYTELGPQ